VFCRTKSSRRIPSPRPAALSNYLGFAQICIATARTPIPTTSTFNVTDIAVAVLVVGPTTNTAAPRRMVMSPSIAPNRLRRPGGFSITFALMNPDSHIPLLTCEDRIYATHQGLDRRRSATHPFRTIDAHHLPR